jgi:hypothetical protein
MRRHVSLTNEWARHPFRARTLLLEPMHDDPVTEAALTPPPVSQLREDLTFFLVSFAAGFIIIFGMIA